VGQFDRLADVTENVNSKPFGLPRHQTLRNRTIAMPKTRSRQKPSRRPTRFQYRSGSAKDNLTHYLFRYPAKFHPPIVRELIKRFSRKGDVILDPFVGSGTLLVEALKMGRHSIGIDVDPIAVEVARAKVMRFNIKKLDIAANRLLRSLSKYERPAIEYTRRMHIDLSVASFREQLAPVRQYVPQIPDIEHWFRRYVIVDLARILRTIDRSSIGSRPKRFFKVVFASVIRNSSNADPVPVSGLEVTSHMLRLDAEGRLINPFTLFRRAIRSALQSIESLNEAAPRGITTCVIAGSATAGHRAVQKPVDAVITSPPYQGAVDYYRRHKLEMYWLDLTKTESERLKLLDRYIGRVTVPARLVHDELQIGPLASRWAKRIGKRSRARAAGFTHYVQSMSAMFEGIARQMRPGRPAVFVVGNSNWKGLEIPTVRLLEEAAGRYFSLDEILTYPIKNRYMSYTRHNGANIRKEYVLVMRRTRTRCA